ncbi:MAG: hypothetical protein WAN43_03755 [Rhodomicrobium sp.]
MGSAGLVIAAIFIFGLGAAAGVAFFLNQQNKGEAARFFAPRSRRIAFVERAALDGGRKLMLVRRDDVEHLILVGGPIDLVVETGIRLEAAAAPIKDETPISLDAAPLALATEWALVQPAPSLEPAEPAEPRLSLSPAAEESAPAPEQQQAKAAE